MTNLSRHYYSGTQVMKYKIYDTIPEHVKSILSSTVESRASRGANELELSNVI